MMSRRPILAGLVAALAFTLAISGCSLADVSLPGAAPSGPGYEVTAEFSDVLDLVPQAAVKVNDVTVGSVERIWLVGWTARVRMKVDRGVQLPTNATAAIRQTSLLGEKFVSLAAPVDQPVQGSLAANGFIPLTRTTRTAEVEEVLSALGLLLNGGGLAQLKTINEELSKALQGREPDVTDLLHQLDTFMSGLDAQKADIARAIDALDSFSAHLAQQKDTIGKAVDALDPGLTVLAQQEEQLTGTLTALSQLSTVGTRVVNQSRDATLASLQSLQPVLTQLVKAGDNLPKAVDFMLTYPFPPNVTGAISGNFVNLHLTVDLNGADILANLLAQPAGTPASSGTPAGGSGTKGGSPATGSGTPTLPSVPRLLGGILPGGPTPTPTPSAGSGSGGGNCGLLGILIGCTP
jgi:phospholipid/cholesterol/gamma-HCH transport system substrate-binding protein